MIVKIEKEQLPVCLDIIHRSFATEAESFGLNEQNCPGHTSFMKLEKLQNFFDWGFRMFGLCENGQLIGYLSLSHKEESIYELHNLAILPEFRHKGYGSFLLEYAKERVLGWGGNKIIIGIIEESTVLMKWYEANGFIHKGTRKYENLLFTVGYMEWSN